MEESSPILDYTALPPEFIQRTRRNKILSIIVIILGCLSVIGAANLEIRNIRVGSPLPLPGGVHPKWRELSNRMIDKGWRARHFDPILVPDWETKPLTPAELADFDKYRLKVEADIAFQRALSYSCWLYPDVAVLLVTIPILLLRFRAGRWRAALAVVLFMQLLVIFSMYRLGYVPAIWFD